MQARQRSSSIQLLLRLLVVLVVLSLVACTHRRRRGGGDDDDATQAGDDDDATQAGDDDDATQAGDNDDAGPPGDDDDAGPPGDDDDTSAGDDDDSSPAGLGNNCLEWPFVLELPARYDSRELAVGHPAYPPSELLGTGIHLGFYEDFEFMGSAGETFGAIVLGGVDTSRPEGDPARIALLGPDCEELLIIDAVGPYRLAMIEAFVLPRTGIYTLVATTDDLPKVYRFQLFADWGPFVLEDWLVGF